MRTPKRIVTRRPWEFSKKLALWAIIVATLSAGASFALAVFDKQPITDLTGTIFTACIGYLITYAAKSLGEKVSRNRHGLDADGNPINSPNGGATEYTEEAKG